MLLLEAFIPSNHALVPRFRILSDEEVEKVLKKYKITKKQLPKILKKDPMLKPVADKIKIGDVIEIERTETTGIKYLYYRIVVSE